VLQSEAESILLKHACIATLMMTGTVTGAPRYIGTVTADGRLWVDSAGISNHATIFQGSVIETEEVPAKLRLATGASVWLDVATRAEVFQDHLLLQKGRAQLDAGSAFRIEAKTLRVALSSPESRAVVGIQDSGAVQVGALNGEAEVRNAQDRMVARIGRGRPVDLRLDTGGGSLVTGCVSKFANSFVLRDEVAGVPVELRGHALRDYLGKRVQVAGTAADSRATAAVQAIQTSTLKVLGTGCTPSMAASAGISPPAAVLGGVAVAPDSGSVARVAAVKKHKPHISHGR
jgi:hypothetical protein